MSLQPGDEVTIYEHPLEETNPEGDAVLVKRLGELGSINGRAIGQWQVEFVDGGYRCVRTVLEDFVYGEKPIAWLLEHAASEVRYLADRFGQAATRKEWHGEDSATDRAEVARLRALTTALIARSKETA